ncbi:hypothetical protein IJ843_01210 [bacterium]|nr:hypothetical protein [bacterium]
MFLKFGTTNSEDVLIITEDYEIKGTVFNVGFSKKNRFLSDLLNKANKNFIAVKDCEIMYKNRGGETEFIDFLQINMRYVVLIRPLKPEEKSEFLANKKG